MSFYHVLTSNVAPATFPNNCASNFSTPIHNPYDFDGKWQIALTQMTHSNCVCTFNGESYVIEDKFVNHDVLQRLNTHIKIELKFSKTTLTRKEFYKELINNISQHDLLRHVLSVYTQRRRTYWKIVYPQLFLVISRDLQVACQLFSQVLTNDDAYCASGYDVRNKVTIKEASIIIGKNTVNAEHYLLKKENVEMSFPELLKVYNEKLPASVTSMTWHDSKKKIFLNKHAKDGIVVILSEGLNAFLGLFHAGYLYPDKPTFLTSIRSLSYTLPWSVTLVRLKPEPFTAFTVNHHLAKKQFTTRGEACNYLNSLDKRVSFTCDEQNIVTMKIRNKFVTVKFDNDLRDILAFDKNEYNGLGTYTASNIFSLSRRIHYLYVYSNINQLIRIGDTQAPLLAILPFDDSKCVPHVERTFKYPMYISLMRNRIAQIDIEIRDDTGQLVPFTEDALTTLRIHFRQVYANP